MDIFRIIVIALAACMLCVFLKQYKKEYAMLISLCAGLIILAWCAPETENLLDKPKRFAAMAGSLGEYVLTAFKIAALSYMTSYGSEMCRDAGEGALAAKVEMCGKILMLAFALPAASALFETIEGIIP